MIFEILKISYFLRVLSIVGKYTSDDLSLLHFEWLDTRKSIFLHSTVGMW